MVGVYNMRHIFTYQTHAWEEPPQQTFKTAYALLFCAPW